MIVVKASRDCFQINIAQPALASLFSDYLFPQDGDILVLNSHFLLLLNKIDRMKVMMLTPVVNRAKQVAKIARRIMISIPV